MTPAAKKLLEDVLALPESERWEVVEVLLTSLPPVSPEETESAWFEEARRRADRVAAGEVQPLDGETALRGIENELRAVRPAMPPYEG